jgi:hypothetical protein
MLLLGGGGKNNMSSNPSSVTIQLILVILSGVYLLQK